MSDLNKNKRVAGVKWARPQEYSKGLYAAPLAPDPDAPKPLFWLKLVGEELFFVNSSTETLAMVSTSAGGFETCDDDVVTISNGEGYTYKNVNPDEAVKIESFCPVSDSDSVFQISIHIESGILGKMEITSPMEKGKVSGQVLVWDDHRGEK